MKTELEGRSHKPRILVVEGFLSHAKSIGSHLNGYLEPVQLLSAHDAETALALLDKESVDLLIIDVCLRGQQDGFDLCRGIRASEEHKSLPIILLMSGHLSLERSRGISSGADLLLHRPVVKEELFKMVQILFDLSLIRENQGHKVPAQKRTIRLVQSAG
ncbi:MAG: response regulator [Deltaproteobacteria bacterium]|nr:response regulator [Deltaproteobacteria bacterium]